MAKIGDRVKINNNFAEEHYLPSYRESLKNKEGIIAHLLLDGAIIMFPVTESPSVIKMSFKEFDIVSNAENFIFGI